MGSRVFTTVMYTFMILQLYMRADADTESFPLLGPKGKVIKHKRSDMLKKNIFKRLAQCNLLLLVHYGLVNLNQFTNNIILCFKMCLKT